MRVAVSGDGVFQLEGWAAGIEAGVGHAGGGFSGWPRGELDDVGVAQRPCERCFEGLMVEEPGSGEMNGAEQVGVEEYGLSLGQPRGQCVERAGELAQLFGGELGVAFELIDDRGEERRGAFRVCRRTPRPSALDGCRGPRPLWGRG